jgi:outer membrane protein assembly factor BamB
MKKKWKIILSILIVIIIVITILGYNIFQSVAGSETLTGSQSSIPETLASIPELTKGNADWPNWRGPTFDGKINIQGIKTDWTGGLKKVWSVDYICQGRATASWAAPVVQGNRLIVPGRDDTKDYVFCLNAETGKLIWKGDYNAPAADSHGPGARATPFIDNDRVYTFGRSGDLVCWQLLDGKVLWHKNVKDVGGAEPDWGLSSSPLVFENKVIVQGGGKALVIAYDKMTGDVLWKSLDGPSGYSATIPVKIDSAQFLLVYHALALSCIAPTDGKELWRVPWETEYGVNASTPAIENDLIFHTSGYGKGGQVIKITKDNFKILWTNQIIASQHSDPIIINDYIYGYSGQSNQNKGDFKCVELKTGKEIWSTKEVGWGTAIAVNNQIICLDIKGNLFLIKPEPSGFKKVTEFKNAIPDVSNPAWTVPIAANGKLYLRYMQHLICYDLMP